MKKFISFLLFSILIININSLKAQEISGLFFCPGVGARIPFSSTAERYGSGYSFGTAFEYASSALPFFYKVDLRYTFLPQNKLIDEKFYQGYFYSLGFGINYPVTPLINDEFIALTFFGFDLRYALHEEKMSTFSKLVIYSNTYTNKLGFSTYIGFSLFLLDFSLEYLYYPDNVFIGINYSLRLPIYISM